MFLKLCILTFFNMLCVFGSSLTFVTDTTVSMKEELFMIKRNLRSFSNDFRSLSVDKFISLPFGSSEQFESSTTWSVDAFGRSISRLTPLGGGEQCPENSMAAIHKALELSDDGSYIFMFTDAYSVDYNVEDIKRLCQSKKTTVVIFLTGYCLPTERHPAGDVNVYSDVTSACAGALFRLDSDFMPQAFKIITEMLKSGWTESMSATDSSGYITLKVPVPSSTSDLVLAVGGAEMTTTLIHEDGSRIALHKIVDAEYSAPRSKFSVSTQLLRAHGLRPGMVTVEIKARDEIFLTVFSRRDFPFSYGFSPRNPRSIKETSSKPMPGRDIKLLIEVPIDSNSDLNYAEMLLESGDRMILTLNKISQETKMYLSNVFKVNEAFKLSIYGRDLNTNKDFVETTSMLQPQINSGIKPDSSKPSIELLDRDSIVVESGSTITFSCKVTSYPEPLMTWHDDKNVSYTPENVFLEIPSTYISYVTIVNVTNNNTYFCKSENKKGNSDAVYQVFVKKNYYIEEIIVPYDQTVKYGTEAELHCKFKAVPEATIKWYLNDSSIFFNNNLEVKADNSLKINAMGLDEVGNYTCEASNAYESKRVSALVSISGLEAPKIESKSNNSFVWNLGSREELDCRVTHGIPTPKIEWQFRSKKDNFFTSVSLDLSSEDTKLVFKDVGKHHIGTYNCIASNIEGEDSREFQVNVRLPPNIVNPKEEYIQVMEHGAVKLPCAVDADSNATIHWERTKRSGSVPLVERHFVDYYQTLTFTALQKDDGDYTCVANNDVGEDRRVVHVNVLVRPYIKSPASQILRATLGSSVVLPCTVLHGNPTPVTHWEFISKTDGPPEILNRSAGDLVLNSVTADNAGLYTCIARNSVGTDSIKIRMVVQQ